MLMAQRVPRNRRLLTAVPMLAAMVVSLALTQSVATANGDAAKCQLKSSHTVVQNEHVRIYRRRGDTFGCLRSQNKRYKLGTYRRDDFLIAGQRNLRLAGRYVAYEDFHEGKDGLQYHVVVFDLRTGRRKHDVATGPTPPATGVIGFAYGIGSTTAIRLRATGAVGWIARNRYVDSPLYEVRKRDTARSRGVNGDGGTELLAQGPNIDPTSLGLRGASLSWNQDGQRHTARLGR